MPNRRAPRQRTRPAGGLLDDPALHQAAEAYALAQAAFYTPEVMAAYAVLRPANIAHVKAQLAYRSRENHNYQSTVPAAVRAVLAAMPPGAQELLELASAAWGVHYLADGLTRAERRTLHSVLAYYQQQYTVPLFPPWPK